MHFSAVEDSAQSLRLWIHPLCFFLLAQEKRSVLVVLWILAFLTGNTLYLLYTFSSQQLYNRWATFPLLMIEGSDNCQGGKEGNPLSSTLWEEMCILKVSAVFVNIIVTPFNGGKECVCYSHQWTMLLPMNDITRVWMGQGVMMHCRVAAWNMYTCCCLTYQSRVDTFFMLGLLNFDHCDWT